MKNVSLCCHMINWIFLFFIVAIFDLAYVCFLLSVIKNVSLCGHIIISRLVVVCFEFYLVVFGFIIESTVFLC